MFVTDVTEVTEKVSKVLSRPLFYATFRTAFSPPHPSKLATLPCKIRKSTQPSANGMCSEHIAPFVFPKHARARDGAQLCTLAVYTV